MITVTFFKERGNKAADDFRVSTGHRGDPLGEWDYLTLDKRLRDMGVRFVVMDYANNKPLPLYFAGKIKVPVYLNLHYGDSYENSVAYPEKGILEAAAIRQWIMASIKKIAPEKLSIAENLHSINDSTHVIQPIETVTIAKATPVAETPKVETKPTVTDGELQETAGGLFKLGLGIGGTLLVAALAIAGVAVGSMAADNFNNDDDENLANSSLDGDDEFPLFIESITGGKMDFAKIWEERAPTFLKSKPKAEEAKAVKVEKSMETPVPINVQTRPIENSPFDTDL